MNNADYFKDSCSTEEHLSPSHTARASVCPYTSPLGILFQDVSPPPVIWIIPFPFVMYVLTHYPEMYSPNLFKHLRQGLLPVLRPGWEVGTNTTPYSYTPKGRLSLVTPFLRQAQDKPPPHGKYVIFLRMRIIPLHTHRHKLFYEELGSQR